MFRKLIIIGLSSLLNFLIVCNNPAAAFSKTSLIDTIYKNSFEIIISLEKNVYLEEEYIRLNFNIKNVSGKIDSLKDFFDIEIHPKLVLKNNGLRLNYHGIVDGISRDSYFIFKPGEYRDYTFMLHDCFGNTKQEAYNDSKQIYLPAGTYTISFYSDREVFGYILSSNTLTFEILKPLGIENDACNELKEIYKVEPSTDLSLMYRNFVYKYYESPYMDQAFELYLSIRLGPYEYHYADMIINDCKWFVEYKPNSTSVQLVLINCYEMLERYYDRSDAIEYLNIISSNYNDFKAGKEAKKLLDKYTK